MKPENTQIEFDIEGPLLGSSVPCSAILRQLPEWFGIEAALLEYERQIDRLPTFLASSGGTVIGFLSLKQHTLYAAEIFVMGVRKEAHHRGCGRALVERAESHARGQGIEYLQVKTLGPSSPDACYAKTRAFYLAMGYRPLEELRQIWDEQNPCLILVKKL